MRRQNRIRLGQISEVVLNSVAVAGIVTVFALVPGASEILKLFFKKKKYQPAQAISKSIHSLVDKGLIEIVTVNGNPSLKLTKKGRWEAGIRGYFKDGDTAKKKWDGVWHVVVFDVPEQKRKVRAELRRAMVLFGFKLLQRSVWVYPYPCEALISLIKEHLGISSDVLYMKALYIENDKMLRKEFRI